MNNSIDSIQQKIQECESRLGNLERIVHQLTNAVRMKNGEETLIQVTASTLQGSGEKTGTPEDTGLFSSIIEYVRENDLLNHISLVCFIFMIALILRVLPEWGGLSLWTGAWAGIGYGMVLMGTAWIVKNRKRSEGVLLAVSSSILICTITQEATIRYAVLSEGIGHTLLGGMMICGGGVGILLRSPSVLGISILGGVIEAFVLNLGKINFAFLGSIAIISVMLALLAFAYELGGFWLRMCTSTFMLLFCGVWIERLRYVSINPSEKVTADHLELFLYFVGVILFLTLFWSIWRVFRYETPLDRMDRLFLSVGLNVSYGLTWVYQSYSNSKSWISAIIYMFIVALCIGFTFYTADKREKHQNTLNPFLLAGISLFLLIFPSVIPILPLYTLIWSITATVLQILGRRLWNSKLNALAFTIHLITFVTIIYTKSIFWVLPHPGRSIMLAFYFAGVLFYHYYNLYQTDTFPGFNALIGQNRIRWMNFLLLACVVIAFLGGLRVSLYVILDRWLQAPHDALKIIDSILISLVAASSLTVGIKRANRDYLIVALTTTLIAGAKVFVYDLFFVTGIYPIISIFVFGVLAAACSLFVHNAKTAKYLLPEHQ